VRVFCEDDESYEIYAYELIVVSAAGPKKSVLRHLRKKCRPGCQILCRTSQGLRSLVYPPAKDRDVRGFHIKSQQRAEGDQTISTLLLETAGSAAADVRLTWIHGIDSRLASQILRLMNRTLEEETTIGFPGPIEDETGFALMRQLHADVEAGRRHVLVAEKDGTIVGQLILTPNSVPNHHHMVELTRGTIDRSFRGGGLALRAFAEVARKCEELGREVICLDVRAGTMAAIWWQHFGFKPFGLLSDYSRVKDKRYQGLFLSQSTADLKKRVEELAGKSVAAGDLLPQD
jgi:GNAT superfamily N-acetyltransferase